MLTSRWSSAALVSALAAVGCGSVDEADGPDMPDVDTQAPVIASSLPADHAIGVGASDKIVITFSEPMDPGSIQTTYESLDPPIDAVDMQWNDDLTVLTISPDVPLVYAEGIGNDPSMVPAKTYSLTIGKGAADLAGNSLGTDYTLTFATKHRMSIPVWLDSNLTRVAMGGTLLGGSNDIWVGDNDLDKQYRAFLTFDLSTIPTGATIESATWGARQMALAGQPYQGLGPVMAAHVSFASLNGFANIQPISLPGMFSNDDAQNKSLTVTSQVADDIAHRAERGNRSQYRLQIETATNTNGMVDKASFSLATFEMNVVYLVD